MWYNKSLLKANIVKTPPGTKKLTSQRSQPTSNKSLSLRPPCSGENLPPKEEESANRKKGEETPPSSTSVEGKMPSYNNLLDVPVSPEFGKDLISDWGTGDVNNYLNSFIASSSESSTASVVVSTAPTYTTLEPATTAHMHSNMSILNMSKHSPGGSHLGEDCQGSCGLSCVPPSPVSPACLNSLDVNFKRMFSILWHWFYPINSLL